MNFATFSRFKSKDRREKETKERHLCLSLSAGNIAGTLNICLCPYVLKTLRIKNRVETYSLCCLPIELPPFAYSFSASFASIYSRKMSYSPLKILHGKLELPTTNDNILSQPRCPYLPLSWGWQEDEVAWCV